MLDLAQLLRVPQVDHLFDISPVGSKLAFAWNKTGDWQIYEMSLSPSPNGRGARVEGAVQLTSGPGGKFNPRYSPDGTKLAYASDIDGGESYHLVVYDFTTKQDTDLTPNIPHALQPNFCWSPDGSQLAFLSDEKGHFSAYIISSDGGEPQLVLDTGHPAWQVEWSPDGKHLAVSCEMRGQDYGIFIVEVCHSERSEESPPLLKRPFAVAQGHAPRGMVTGQSLQNFVNQALRGRSIESFPTPFAAVATRYPTGDLAVLRSGDAGFAVRASCSIPGVFVPAAQGAQEYLDGGLVSPVPVRTARQLGADVVVAVDVGGADPAGDQTGGLFELLQRSFEIMSHALRTNEVATADIAIRPDVGRISSTDFASRKVFIAAGFLAAQRLGPVILERLAAGPRRRG